MRVFVCVRFFQAVKALALPALNKIICVQTSILMYVCINVHTNVYKSSTFICCCLCAHANRRRSCFEFKSRSCKTSHCGTTCPWSMGDGDTMYPIYGNQNAMQSKCTINKGPPFPSPDGAAVKLNCFGCRCFCCCCCLCQHCCSFTQKSWQVYWVEEKAAIFCFVYCI